jgi:hypothetical protein
LVEGRVDWTNERIEVRIDLWKATKSEEIEGIATILLGGVLASKEMFLNRSRWKETIAYSARTQRSLEGLLMLQLLWNEM